MVLRAENVKGPEDAFLARYRTLVTFTPTRGKQRCRKLRHPSIETTCRVSEWLEPVRTLCFKERRAVLALLHPACRYAGGFLLGFVLLLT